MCISKFSLPLPWKSWQKYVKKDGMVGVDDVERWPVDSDAFGFLSALSTTKSIESLKEVPNSPGHE